MNISTIFGPRVNDAAPFELNAITEYSRFSFAITLIPLVGDLFQIFQEFSLRGKILNEITNRSSFSSLLFGNSQQLDALIQVKNTYKAMGCLRCLIECAITIGFLASHVLTRAQVISHVFSAFLFAGVAAFFAKQISTNNELRAALQSGHPPTVYQIA